MANDKENDRGGGSLPPERFDSSTALVTQRAVARTGERGPNEPIEGDYQEPRSWRHIHDDFFYFEPWVWTFTTGYEGDTVSPNDEWYQNHTTLDALAGPCEDKTR